MASTTAQTTLSSATTGAGTTIDFTTAVSNVSMVLTTTGTILRGVIALEASQDSSTWVKLNAVSARSARRQHIDSRTGAYRYYRATIVSPVTGGGSVSATLMEAG